MRPTRPSVPPPFRPPMSVKRPAVAQRSPVRRVPSGNPAPIPPAYRPARQPSVVQRYEFTKKEKNKRLELLHRYLEADYLGSLDESTFDAMVKAAATLDDVIRHVDKMEQAKKEREQRLQSFAAAAAIVISTPKPAATTPLPTPSVSTASKLPAKSKKKKLRALKEEEMQGPTPVNPWSQVPTIVSTPTSQPLPSATLLLPPMVAASPVPDLVDKVKRWDGKLDKGTHKGLTAAQIEDFLQQCAAIQTKSQSQRYEVGISVGEQKYQGQLCIKVINFFGQTTSQATTHKPTFHVTVPGMAPCPQSLQGWLLPDK